MPKSKASELEALLSSWEPAAVVDEIIGSAPSGAIIASAPDGKIIRCTDFAAQLLGRSRSDVEGRLVSDVCEQVPFYDAQSDRRLSANELPVTRALLGETVDAFEYRVERAAGERIPCVCSAAPIHNWRGQVIGAISSIADLRPYKSLERGLRFALAQRGTQYRELTHRVKGHLQIMTSMVALEGRSPTLSTKGLAEQMKGQLQALAAVYRGMDRAEAGEAIEARAFVEEICCPYSTDAVSVDAEIAPADLRLAPEQAGPIGMLLSEAVRNSRKHAFPHHGGHIHVALRRVEPGQLHLEVADDGVGWGSVDPSEASHGLDLMRMFAKQLHGDLDLSVHRLGGTLVKAEIPVA
jgi:two-component sensor histidine kinase